MAEQRRPERPASNPPHVIGFVRDHRVNDLLFGHVGRLTYVSPEDDDRQDSAVNNSYGVGKLLANRTAGITHTFQEVTPFRTWYRPTASGLPRNKKSGHKDFNMFLQDAPELSIDTAGAFHTELLEDLRESEGLDRPQTRLPLLSYGEITDLRTREPTGCTALAMAAGEAGHVLRIVRVRHEDWGWSESCNVSVQLSNIDKMEEGHWCGGAFAINQIKFAANSQAGRPTRWVLVQTAAETIVFEPTLHEVPVKSRQSACDHIGHGPPYISTAPSIRIPMKETGGRPHCDVAFNPDTESRPPQLAIIDDGGNWSVWNITGDRHARKHRLRPFLQARGNVMDGVSPSPSVAAAHGLGHLHRIAWLPTSLAYSKGEAGMAGAPLADYRSNTLLLCNATSVYVVNVDEKNGLLRTFNVAHSNGLDVIVDIQISPINASHVFVLTTTALFWLDLSRLDETFPQGQKGIRDTPRAPSRAKQPHVLLSCPHLRDPADTTTKLYLTSSKSIQGEDIAIALVYSMEHPEVAIFWFLEAVFGREAAYQQQVFQFTRQDDKHSSGKSRSEKLGEQTMLVLPKHIRIAAYSPRPEENAGQEYVNDGIRLFQVIALGTDLRLQSSLCISSPRSASMAITPPILIDKRKGSERKKDASRKHTAAVRFFGNSFVVSDSFEERRRFQGPKARRSKSQSKVARSGKRLARNVQIYNMASVFTFLSRSMTEAATAAYQATHVIRGFQNPSPLDLIRQIIEFGFENGSFPFTALLNVASADFMRDYDADLTDFSWARQLAELGTFKESRVTVFDQMQEVRSHNRGAATLYEAMAKLCAVAVAGESQQKEGGLVRQQGLLAYAAIQLFFSQISVVVMPRQVASSARNTPGLEDGQSAASTPFSAHFVGPDADSRFHGGLSSSPAPRGVPSWLPSSSQDYGMEGGQSPGHGSRFGGRDDDAVRSKEGDKEGETEEQEEEEDAAIARLRQYAKSIKSEPPRREGQLRLLSHWPLGSDPSQFHWVPRGAAGEAEEEEEMERRAQAARERRRKGSEKRAMRDRERMLMLAGIGGPLSSPAAPRIQPSSQILSSQMVASPIRPSQVFSSQVMPSSQPTIRAGIFGQRPKKKKPKVARGFK